MKRVSLLLMLAFFLTGCTSVNQLNTSRDDIHTLYMNPDVTFSDYGNGIKFDTEKGLYRYDVFIGGFGGCKGSLLRYAKPKMDTFMIENQFSTYTIVETHHKKSPPTKCIVFIDYEK